MNVTSQVGTTTIMMCLLFGTNFFLFILFQAMKRTAKPTEAAVSKSNEKKFSKPFTGTLDCFANLTSELFYTGLVMGLTYVCENHWIFEHSKKFYSRDLFLFVLIIFFAYALYTIKPVHDLTLLGREQTEEWKGWMQFIFLMYHYFHAEEVYNSVRVMITCYVWMTGFGNFSFFYIKKDFGWLRVAQMLWRLNFSCLLLMWTHGNTYILYYICPMHTFYFCMVYVTMYLFASVNNTKWMIRVKLLVLGILIYIIWDINGGIFDVLFSFLGTDKIIGATSGSVWEYYFRTSLDHWSTYLGMIFALNFPLAEQYFVKAQGWPLVLASVAMGALTIWWVVYFYTLEKMTYNLYHSYFAIIPLTSYIFFRNLTPAIRSGVSMSLHEIGKTTLETYLLQHHIWLTSNAKTLLTIVPDSPWINFALTSVLFVVVSKELYRLTMSLRYVLYLHLHLHLWHHC
jgi:N-acetylneuraminate 9-O-acetyltransferase